MSTANETCPLESAFQAVNSSYNWTHAYKTYDQYTADIDTKDQLEVLLLVNANPGRDFGSTPGCFFLGTLNRTKVEQCESVGGMAIVNSRTKKAIDADVWFCGLPGNGYERSGPRPDSSLVMDIKRRVDDVLITCVSPPSSAALRPAWSWIPMLAVGLSSLVASL